MIAVRHALLEEYDTAALLAARTVREFESALAPGALPELERAAAAAVRLRDGGELLVAVADGAILAGAAVYREAGAAGDGAPDGWAAIHALAVAPEQRRRGAGRALAAACLDLARADGASGLGLVLGEPMAAARALCAALGLRPAGAAPPLSGMPRRIYGVEL